MAPTQAATDALLSLMRPWLPTLQRLELPEYESPGPSEEQRILWLNARDFFQAEAAKEPLDSVCEALSLLASLHTTARKQILPKKWPADKRLVEWLGDAGREDFVLGFDATEMSTRWVDGLNRLYSQIASDTGTSKEYKTMLQEVKPQGLSTDSAEDHTKIPTRIVVDA